MRALGRLVLGICMLVPASPSKAAVFGLVDTGEIYSSVNGGVTWTALATLPVNDAAGLAAGSTTSQLFIVTRSGSLYRSMDAGATWSAVGALTGSDVASFTINYDGAILVLTESGTLYGSRDGGATFAGLAALTGSSFVSLVRGPIGRLFALASTGEIYESQNQGTSWTAVGSVFLSNAVAIRRKASELYVLAQTGEIYRSIDYGRTWLAVGAITASNMRAILDSGSSLLAAAETGEVYTSSNGAVWSAIGAINQLRVMALGTDTPLATGVPTYDTPPAFRVSAPQPNPTTPDGGSMFGVSTSQPGQALLELFDARGRRVLSLGPISLIQGMNKIPWRPAGVPGGVYLVRLTTGIGQAASTKWSLIR